VLPLLLALLIAGAAHAQTPPGATAIPGVGYPSALPASVIPADGTAVTLLPAGWMVGKFAVCDIQNDPGANEPLYLDLVNVAAAGQPTSFALQAGQAYRISRPIGTAVTAWGATPGHLVIGVCY